MRVYAISSNVYKESCESDTLDDVLTMMEKVLRAGPIGTQIHITVRDIPQEVWDSQPTIEPWNDKNGKSKD